MNKFIVAIIILTIVGCVDLKPKQKVVQATEKKQSQVKSKIELKREIMNLAANGKLSPKGVFFAQDSTLKTIDDFKGKLLAIDFWASWCSPCLVETPIFKGFEEKYGNEKVEFITMSIDYSFSEWKEFIAERKWKSDNYWFGEKESDPFFSYMYSEVDSTKNVIISLPKYVFISPDGKIINNQASKPSKPAFEKELKRLIKKHT